MKRVKLLAKVVHLCTKSNNK